MGIGLPLVFNLACGGKSDDSAADADTEDTTDTEDTEDTSDTDDTDDTGDTDDTDDTAVDPGEAMVRVVHLSPDAPSVDVYANGAAVGVNDVPFPAGSGYLTVPAGEYTFEVAPAGTSYDDVVPVGLTATLEADTSYTAIAHGYIDPVNGSNGFATSPSVNDMASISDGNLSSSGWCRRRR